MDPGLRAIVTARLEADSSVDASWSALVLGALEGDKGLEAELSGSAPARGAPSARTAATPTGAFLRSVAVEGFRGIGPTQTLELAPGPGLTLVVGRNGSGKSSFAEAIEVLLTGDSLRWKERAAVWRDGWRNLHHPATFLKARSSWKAKRARVSSRAAGRRPRSSRSPQLGVELPGRPGSDLDSLGWTGALRTHRPFLSYNELGSLLDEGPSKLYDALSAILGLEDLVGAQAVLQEARRSREKAMKEAGEARLRLLERMHGVDDDRARRVAAAIEGKEWDLDAVDAVLGEGGSLGKGAAETDVLRAIAGLEPPDPARVAAAVAEMRAARKALTAAEGTAAARSRDAAKLLEQALAFHAAHGDGDCPVCGRERALDKAWDKKGRTNSSACRSRRGRRRPRTSGRRRHGASGRPWRS